MSEHSLTRRRFVELTGTVGVLSLAGCTDEETNGTEDEPEEDDSDEPIDETGEDDAAEDDPSEDEEDDETYTLTVTVEDESGEPIAGAEVEVDDFDEPDEETGSDGQISFDLSEGEYTVEAETEGFESSETTVTIDGSNESITLTLAEDDNGGNDDD
jgi:protocatechuate 3,4-dioxygenase beta subunit